MYNKERRLKYETLFRKLHSRKCWINYTYIIEYIKLEDLKIQINLCAIIDVELTLNPMDYRSGEISLPFLYASEMVIFQWVIYNSCIGKKKKFI